MLRKNQWLLIFLLLPFFSYAWNDPSKYKSNHTLKSKAAGCSPATGRKILEFNNVSALIETGGSMWQDRSKNDAAYEIPKGSGERVIYAGALWMGGLDVNNQLKLAALTFRSGNDFWTGPLSTIPGTGNLNLGYLDYGPAEIEPDVCVAYDQFYITTRQEVELFNAWFECSKDPDCDVNVDFPGYSYHSGIVFSIFQPKSGVPLINGGQYKTPFSKANKKERKGMGFDIDLISILKLQGK